MADVEFVRKTFTLTKEDYEGLVKIVQRRHRQFFRVDSQVIRELIREELERMEHQQKAEARDE